MKTKKIFTDKEKAQYYKEKYYQEKTRHAALRRFLDNIQAQVDALKMLYK